MKSMKLISFGLSCLALSAGAFACSPANDSDLNPEGSGAAGSGGAEGGTGGAAGTGGDGQLGTGGAVGSGGALGTGGDVAGTGGANAGGAFVCPAGSESLVLDVTGKTPIEIMGLPERENTNYLEGPVWFEGALYMSQFQNYGNPSPGRILKYTPGGAFEVAFENANSNGLAVDGTGLLVSANQGVYGIATLDPANPGAAPVVVADSYNGASFNSPNDLTIRNDGNIYFTDPSWQCDGCSNQTVKGVYRIPPGGVPELVTTAPQNNPNGIALSPDQNTLYIGGSEDNKLTAHPLQADGSVGAGSDFGGVRGTDGLGVDCAGNVYAALNQVGELKVLSPAGTEIAKFTGLPSVTNAAFGGPNNTTLYITSQEPDDGKLYSVELNVPGFPY